MSFILYKLHHTRVPSWLGEVLHALQPKIKNPSHTEREFLCSSHILFFNTIANTFSQGLGGTVTLSTIGMDTGRWTLVHHPPEEELASWTLSLVSLPSLTSLTSWTAPGRETSSRKIRDFVKETKFMTSHQIQPDSWKPSLKISWAPKDICFWTTFQIWAAARGGSERWQVKKKGGGTLWIERWEHESKGKMYFLFSNPCTAAQKPLYNICLLDPHTWPSLPAPPHCRQSPLSIRHPDKFISAPP